MAEKNTEKVEKVEKTDREVRWEAFVAKFAAKNPKKFALRKEAGELDTIPASFV